MGGKAIKSLKSNIKYSLLRSPISSYYYSAPFRSLTAIRIDAPRCASAFRSHNWVTQQMEMETELEAEAEALEVGQAQQLRQRAAQMPWAMRVPAPAPAASALPPYKEEGQEQEWEEEAIIHWSRWQQHHPHRRQAKRGKAKSDVTPSCDPLRLRLIALPRLRSICGKRKIIHNIIHTWYISI